MLVREGFFAQCTFFCFFTGRLASIIAKKLLTGRKIVVVRCEQLVYSGARFRQQRRAIQRKAKRTLTNPKKGPFHERAPSRVFQRVVRGMLPHRTPRGEKTRRKVAHETLNCVFFRFQALLLLAA
jgi:ribosomal protein uL13